MIDVAGKHVMVVGAGSSIMKYKENILEYIENNNVLTIGINKMTSFCTPTYHLWTNKKRFASYHECIADQSKLLFGCGMSDSFIKRYWNGKYYKVDYKNSDAEKISYKNGMIIGNFRTAGILAIMIAYVSKAKKIDIVGMDGYTLHGKDFLLNKSENHHCYGEGYTDDASWETCLKKDDIVDQGLHELREYGVDFEILTPTKFKDFYNSDALE